MNLSRRIGVLAALGLGALAGGTLAGCGAGGDAGSPPRPTPTSIHSRHVRNLPNIYPEATDPTTGQSGYTLQLAGSSAVPVGSYSGLAVSSSPETVTFSDVQAGSQMQTFHDLYQASVNGDSSAITTMTVTTTVSGLTHVYVLNGARLTSLSVGAQQASTITSLKVDAQSVQRTS